MSITQWNTNIQHALAQLLTWRALLFGLLPHRLWVWPSWWDFCRGKRTWERTVGLHRCLPELTLNLCVCASSSFYNTKSVVLCLGITALVCLSVTVFSFQSKVRGTTSNDNFKMLRGKQNHTSSLSGADWRHLLPGSAVFLVRGHAPLCHHHLHRRPFRIRESPPLRML